MALLASHWCQRALALLDQLLVPPNLLLALLGICRHLEGALQQLHLQPDSQQLVSLGPNVKVAHHLSSSVGGMAKNLAGKQVLRLAEAVGLQHLQNLGHSGVHWLAAIDNGLHLLDHCWRDGHGFPVPVAALLLSAGLRVWNSSVAVPVASFWSLSGTQEVHGCFLFMEQL